jgi:hypothetical protein
VEDKDIIKDFSEYKFNKFKHCNKLISQNKIYLYLEKRLKKISYIFFIKKKIIY